MKISTKGRYALRLMIDVCQWQSSGPVSLREISERQSVSVKYLEQLARQLMHAGLLKSSRGARGGYSLTKDAGAVTVGDILRACEGGTAPVACLEDNFGVCPRRDECEAIAFWEGLDRVIEEYVDGVTLASITAQSHAKTANKCALD